MKHLGSVTDINGAEIEPVDCIIGGSPCQDLSVAGKRAGLDGQRSSLFMEQIRIVKEMREHDKASGRTDVTARPRWMVWENVPGALSSGTPKGEDFRIVLEEIARIADPDAVIPRPEKWSKSGCIMGNGWSVAYRVHSAEFWGTPQRRYRISLVADFASEWGASEVLFERKGMFRDSEESRDKRKGASADSERSAAPSSYTLKVRGGREIDSLGKRAGKGALVQTELSATLGVSQDQTLITIEHDERSARFTDDEITDPLTSSDYKDPIKVVYGISPYDSGAMKSDNPRSGIYVADTARTLDNNGGSPACNQGGMMVLEGKEVIPLESNHTDGRVKIAKDGVVQTLKERMGTGGNNVPLLMVQEKTGALTPGAHPGSYNGQDAYNNMLVPGPAVRRLTPTECERLQGFPDGWTDIGEWVDEKGKIHKESSDSARYKALGNSIALPFWQWLIKRISATYPRTPTMGSLFDGIGGFPLCWTRTNGVGSVKWASEIEPFCIAVTERHFGENGDIREYL